MFYTSWKYKNAKDEFIYLEKWMKFSIELAYYVKKVPENIKIYISVPSNLLFSYFFLLGAIDYDLRHMNKQSRLDEYLNLQEGQRIRYKTGDNWIAHSVIKIGNIPSSETRAIIVKGQLNTVIYIPENRWLEYVEIHDAEITEVRNVRRVTNMFNNALNPIIKRIYTKSQIELLLKQNIVKTYLNTNKKEWLENLGVIKFELEEEVFLLSDLFFDGSENTFKNLSFIEQNHSVPSQKEATAIFIGSSRSLRKMDSFNNQKCVFIIDQHDSNEMFEDLQFKIEQDFLMNPNQSVNKEILEYMDENQIEIPKGVEIFAWLPES